MLSVPEIGQYDANDPASPEVSVACAGCGLEGLDEDHRWEVEGDVMCAACTLERMTGLAEVVLGRYARASKVEAAKRLDPEFVTLKSLMRHLEREAERLANEV